MNKHVNIHVNISIAEFIYDDDVDGYHIVCMIRYHMWRAEWFSDIVDTKIEVYQGENVIMLYDMSSGVDILEDPYAIESAIKFIKILRKVHRDKKVLKIMLNDLRSILEDEKYGINPYF
ncbi:hypothetical protein SBFV2_gp02 [Sulfolobales Beppu filamentous virus 2]|uniref:Uncharacterized protein n=1 Tax=Sulfolobales Beppu filamentous virus 2 TaxID=2493123 RepID=A0A3S8NEP7_9VIRU|nr:hypothetical protein HOU84_gp02 [Sulfolobales Beppu filamentous virus 2]AZI75769.1 hypothetical protein SBFV2_gp02 [Sulfolobales Beppu filamentous virus 2]